MVDSQYRSIKFGDQAVEWKGLDNKKVDILIIKIGDQFPDPLFIYNGICRWFKIMQPLYIIGFPMRKGLIKIITVDFGMVSLFCKPVCKAVNDKIYTMTLDHPLGDKCDIYIFHYYP